MSDHGPIILDCNLEKVKSKRHYKIEAWCLDFEEVLIILVKYAWKQQILDSSLFTIQRKLEKVKRQGKEWCIKYKQDQKLEWDDIHHDITLLQQNIESAQEIAHEAQKHKEVCFSTYIRLEY